MKIRIPRQRLPDQDAERHGALRKYFCDKDARSTTQGEEWVLDLHWSEDWERYVDPSLKKGLDWWGATLADMPVARKREGRWHLMLSDAWTLFGWSEWLAGQKRPPKNLVILHVDDHRDLMPPRYFIEGDEWKDAISGRSVDVAQPKTVATSIESGALGMGSFMTPMFHATEKIQVRHLRQRTPTAWSEMIPTARPDDLIAPGSLRPAVDLRPIEYDTKVASPFLWLTTAELKTWLADLPEGPILLHIDMDYFNNRYDGDSDWALASQPLDPPISSVKAKISRVCKALGAAGLKDRIVDIAIAFSPGFFPAEYWETSYEVLRSELDVDPESARIRSKVSKAGAKRAAVIASEIKLISGKGTKDRGGGPGGEYWHIHVNEKRVGAVFVNVIDLPPIGRHASIQIFLNLASQGRQIGRVAYRQACEMSQHPVIYAHMRKSNSASVRAAQEAGFVEDLPGGAQRTMIWKKCR